MSDTLPTVWAAEPHTLAKHAILKSYLQAWTPIMARQSARVGRPDRKIRFIDAFAGPGIYSGGEDGSPIPAIKAALEHRVSFPVPVHCLFIEKDAKRFACLQHVLRKYEAQVAASPNISVDPPQNADCSEVIMGILDECQSRGQLFGPALVFLDQTGYSDVPITVIRRVMAQSSCEVFTYLNYSFLNRFLVDEAKDEARTQAFGSDEWKEARSLTGPARERSLLQTYKRALRTTGKTRFVWDFAMADKDDQLIYWLFFCTNHLRGLEEMKKAMRSVDDSGAFRFSDASDPSQLRLLDGFDHEWLAEHLAEKHAGKTMTVREIQRYVLTETPCHVYANALKRLKSSKRIEIPDEGREARPVAFTKDLDRKVRFMDRPLFAT